MINDSKLEDMAYTSARFDSKPAMLYVVAAARGIPRSEVLRRGHDLLAGGLAFYRKTDGVIVSDCDGQGFEFILMLNFQPSAEHGLLGQQLFAKLRIHSLIGSVVEQTGPRVADQLNSHPSTESEMLVYLDTADLINICRCRAPIDLPDLACKLVSGGHKIVLSFDTLIEVAAPLRNGRVLEVRRNLNRLEELPHTFINEARLRDMEMREAISAFEQGREYDFALVSPFASRLDEPIDVQGRPQTRARVDCGNGCRPLIGKPAGALGPFCYHDKSESADAWPQAASPRRRAICAVGVRDTVQVSRHSAAF
jgi:hypothetical protein